MHGNKARAAGWKLRQKSKQVRSSRHRRGAGAPSVALQGGLSATATLRWSRHPGKCFSLWYDVTNCSHRLYTPSTSNSFSPKERAAYFTFQKKKKKMLKTAQTTSVASSLLQAKPHLVFSEASPSFRSWAAVNHLPNLISKPEEQHRTVPCCLPSARSMICQTSQQQTHTPAWP